jgi:hypothetical protein
MRPQAEISLRTYFWRTYDQKEIDCAEERVGQLLGYELKWQGAVRESTLRAFIEAYPGADVHTVTRENWAEVVQIPTS